MPGNSADLAQCVGKLGNRQPLCRQGHHLRYLLSRLPPLVGAYDDAKLFCCPCLRPVHAAAPYLQFKSTHASPRDMQIMRNIPGEILADYERIALSFVGFCV